MSLHFCGETTFPFTFVPFSSLSLSPVGFADFFLHPSLSFPSLPIFVLLFPLRPFLLIVSRWASRKDKKE